MKSATIGLSVGATMRPTFSCDRCQWAFAIGFSLVRSVLRPSVCFAASFEDDRISRGREEKGRDPALPFWRRSKSAHSVRALASRRARQYTRAACCRMLDGAIAAALVRGDPAV